MILTDISKHLRWEHLQVFYHLSNILPFSLNNSPIDFHHIPCVYVGKTPGPREKSQKKYFALYYKVLDI